MSLLLQSSLAALGGRRTKKPADRPQKHDDPGGIAEVAVREGGVARPSYTQLPAIATCRCKLAILGLDSRIAAQFGVV